MGYRLNIEGHHLEKNQEITFYGSKLYGYVSPDELVELESYKYLKELFSTPEFNEYMFENYGENRILLNRNQFEKWIKLYSDDLYEYGELQETYDDIKNNKKKIRKLIDLPEIKKLMETYSTKLLYWN